MFQADVLLSVPHTSGRVFATAEKQLPRGDHATAKLHREWLRQVVADHGIAPTTLAKQARIAPSTLTRPLSEGDEGTSTLHAATIEKIIALTGAKPPGFPRRATRAGGLSEEAKPYEESGGGSIDAALRAIAGHRNAADPWVIRSRALELAGFLPGDVVVVDLNAVPQTGDVVCAQTNIDFTSGTADTVIRLYERAGSAFVLSAATMDGAIRKLIPVDERVALKGVVIGMVRPMREAA